MSFGPTNIIERRSRLGRLYDLASLEAEALDVVGFIEDYNDILKRFPENHEPVDYGMFAVRQPDDFKVSFGGKLLTRLRWSAAAQRPWLILGAIVLGAFGVTVWLV